MSSNPYATPDSDLTPDSSEIASRDYGGLSRLPYFGLAIALTIGNGMVNVALRGNFGNTFLTVTAIVTILSIVLAYFRLNNIGDNGWLCLLLIVPIANLVIGVRCLAYQEGYRDTRKLDTTGKVIVGLFLGMVLIGILAAVMLSKT